MQEPNDLTSACIEGIQDKKGTGIAIIDLSGIESAPASGMIVCEGRNPLQVAAIADSLQDTALSRCGRRPENTDGYRNSQWIVVDYGDTIVHVFQKEERSRYDIEGLWNDAVITEIPDPDGPA